VNATHVLRYAELAPIVLSIKEFEKYAKYQNAPS
jgi:hypothetical protein